MNMLNLGMEHSVLCISETFPRAAVAFDPSRYEHQWRDSAAEISSRLLEGPRHFDLPALFFPVSFIILSPPSI